MSRIIQMVRTAPDNIIFIYGFNEIGELVFRTSRMPKYLQHEPIAIMNGQVILSLYHFPEQCLDIFLHKPE